LIVTVAGFLTGVRALDTVSEILGPVIFVGCLFVLGRRRQALHDFAAGTAVYRRTDLAA
jgi:uncharacterized RDD family membrane protein YckC